MVPVLCEQPSLKCFAALCAAVCRKFGFVRRVAAAESVLQLLSSEGSGQVACVGHQSRLQSWLFLLMHSSLPSWAAAGSPYVFGVQQSSLQV
jgi:hypothetical protein